MYRFGMIAANARHSQFLNLLTYNFVNHVLFYTTQGDQASSMKIHSVENKGGGYKNKKEPISNLK